MIFNPATSNLSAYGLSSAGYVVLKNKYSDSRSVALAVLVNIFCQNGKNIYQTLDF